MGNAKQNDPAVVWDMMKSIGISQFITRDGQDLDCRPMHAYPVPELGLVFYMTDAEHLIDQLSGDGRVLLSFADKSGNNFAAVSGTAVVSNDRARIKELWTVWAEAFWKGADDPRIRLITVTPDHARYWDSPNALVTSIVLLASAVTGKQPKLGTAGEVRM